LNAQLSAIDTSAFILLHSAFNMTLDPYKPEFAHVLEFLRHELGTIHTGRATPVIIEDVSVEVYGSRMSFRRKNQHRLNST
jgi:ribosome recycling factor